MNKKDQEEKPDTWTITVELTVFAGDMDRENVISNADEILSGMFDGSDIAGFSILKAERDEI